MFSYSHVLTRKVPSSLPFGLCQETPSEAVNLEVALQQHEAYNEALRSEIPNLIEIPADDRNPDCVFIEGLIYLA